MSSTIQLKRGALAGLPTGGAGEPLTTTDQIRLYVGNGSTNYLLGLLDKIDATAAPGATDDSAAGYSVGSLWVDTTNNAAYICLDDTAGAAIWSSAVGSATGSVTSVDVSGGTTGLTTSGGPVTISGTITLAGTLVVANGGTGATTAAGARTNLGLGTAATADTGTSGATVPLLNGTNTWSGTQNITIADAVTNSTTDLLKMSHLSSGTVAAGFGIDWHWLLEDAGGSGANALLVRTVWADATHNSSKSRATISAYGGSTAYECVRCESSGSAAMIGFLGAAASAQLASPDLGTLATTFGLASGTCTLAATSLTGTIAAARMPALTGDVTTSAGSVATTLTTGILLPTHLESTGWADVDAYYSGAGQALTQSAWNTITIDTETTDADGLFASNTFTPATTGLYLIDFFCTTNNSGNRIIASVWNGTTSEVQRLTDGVDTLSGCARLVSLTAATGYTFRVFPTAAGISTVGGTGQTGVKIRRIK